MPLFVLWVIVGSLLLIGLVGTVVPGLPGVGLAFAGVLIFAAATQFTLVSVPTVIVFGLIGALAVAADYAGSLLGAKVGGGKRMALAGTIIGSLIGAVSGGPAGLFIGAFLGGLLGALMEGQTHQQAVKIALLSMVGIVGASAFQFVLTLAMIIAFLLAVFW